ncbi:MAG: peptidase S9, partial [Bacteroidota bacterium]
MRLRVDVLLGLLVAGALVGASPVEAQYFRFGKNKVQYDESRWYYVQSTHFDVYYREGNHYLADFTAKASEEAYERLSSLFQYEITDRIPILVYDSHRGFAVTNAVDLPINAEGIGGVTELFKNRVALPFNGDYRSYRQTLHHELVHALMNDMFYGGSIQSIIQNQIQLRIPHWFNEGLAEYASEGWSTDADTWMRDATIHDNLPPIAFLGGFASYQAGQSVWDYVAAQYGEEKIGEILQRLRLTRSVDAAFKRATGLSLDELSERWHKTLKEVHYPEITAREALTDIARPVITRETGGFYNTSPALSPQGDRLAYITTHNGLFDVYVASALDGSEARKVVEGQTSRTFESLRILSPGLSWSPDGTQLAIAVTSGDTEALAVVDVRSGRTTSYPLPQVDQLLSVDWHPSAPQVALSASTDAQSDLYVLDLTTQATTRLTNDLFSDHEPAWSPDGRALVFHSDRGAHTHVSAHPAAAATDAERFEMVAHGYEDTDIYHLTLGQSEAQRLTSTPGWDNRSPQFSADGHHVLFTSDRNGIFNLYSQALHPIANDAVEHPLTNLVVGLSQWDLSADGRRAALVSLNEGTPVIYVLRDPLNRPVDHAPLTPTVWAQRVTPTLTAPAPALALAPPSLLQRNPFLRDATDGRGYFEGPPDATGPLLAALDVPPLDASTSSRIIRSADLRTGGDSTSLEQLRIDFRNYAFGEAFDEAARAERDPLFTDRFSPVDHVDEQGTHTPKRYKLNFSPDIVYGTAGYDMLYGAQGVTQMMFSDMLGNHQIFVSTNLLIDLRNSDYVVSYSYLPRRLDWTISTYHISRLLPDYNQLTYFRFRRFGVGLALSYPLDKCRRVDLDLSMVGVSQANVGDPSRAPS